MQLLAGGHSFDPLADCGAGLAGDAHENFAWREIPWLGADRGLSVALRTQAVNIGLGADPLDRLHGEIKPEAAVRRSAIRQLQVLWPDPEDTRTIGRARQLGVELA